MRTWKLLLAAAGSAIALAVPLAASASSTAPAAPAAAVNQAAVNTMLQHAWTVHNYGPPPPCPTFYSAIENRHTAFYVTGNGVNAPVYLAGGNCFEQIDEGGGYLSWQNGDGHCIWDSGSAIELGKACAGRNSELFTLHNPSGIYNTVQAVFSGKWWNAEDPLMTCGYLSDVNSVSGGSTNTCDQYAVA